MTITYPHLQVLWKNPNRGMCGLLENLPDIEKQKYGYRLEPGQRVCFIGFIVKGAPYEYNVRIEDVGACGVTVSDWGWSEVGGRPIRNSFENFMQTDGSALLPWSCDGMPLEINPLDVLKDRLPLKDVLSGEKDKIADRWGAGLWYRHGGWRTSVSRYDGNREYFVRL